MEALLNEMIPFMKNAWANAGWLGALGGVLMFAIRIFRLSPVQGRLPPKIKWDAWPTWAKWVAPFAGALAGMMIIKVAGGLAWAPAISAAIAAAILSIGGNAGTKKLGEMEGAYKSGKDPNYQPSPFRSVASIAIPVAKHIRENGPPPQ